MKDFRVGRLPQSSVQYLFAIRSEIQTDPDYQRQGDAWDKSKRQLLLDSVINGFDVPKIYFREFYPPENIDGTLYSYAIIDGKQRLGAIWDFLDGKLALSDDFSYLDDDAVDASGMTYEELSKKYPHLATLFTSWTLDVVTIQFLDEDLVEDMFQRLNEAVPLNAAEKRNAFGGPIPKLIKELVQHPFFVSKLPFGNHRYRHFDLAAKFLLFEQNGGVADTKKAYLDKFTKDHKGTLRKDVEVLLGNAKYTCDVLQDVFEDSDKLLRSVGMVSLYYLLAFSAIEDDWNESLSRSSLVAFERKRAENRAVAQGDIASAEYELLEFDRFAQSPNDAIALEYRLDVLTNYLGVS